MIATAKKPLATLTVSEVAWKLLRMSPWHCKPNDKKPANAKMLHMTSPNPILVKETRFQFCIVCVSSERKMMKLLCMQTKENENVPSPTKKLSEMKVTSTGGTFCARAEAGAPIETITAKRTSAVMETKDDHAS